MVPDLTMRGHDDPHGRTVTARPADWWRLVVFDDAGPAHVPLDAPDGVRLWLTTWPPGAGMTVHGQVSTLIAGELAEVAIAADGVTERPLRANRIRVHAGPQTFTNPGPAYAVSLHAA